MNASATGGGVGGADLAAMAITNAVEAVHKWTNGSTGWFPPPDGRLGPGGIQTHTRTTQQSIKMRAGGMRDGKNMKYKQHQPTGENNAKIITKQIHSSGDIVKATINQKQTRQSTERVERILVEQLRSV